MFWLNKIVWGVVNPTVLIIVLVAITILYKRRWGSGLWLGFVLMWIWAMPLTTRVLGLPLEREWLVAGKVPQAESFPEADAIVLLGGGMGAMTNASPYAEMRMSADRAWQAARLYKAGKAPCIFVTGKGNEFTTKGLLADFGVPTNALIFVDEARNTEEEAGEIVRSFDGSDCLIRGGRPKILLVTSAWHMKRAKMMFGKYARGLDVVPAPADFEATTSFADGFDFDEFLPNGQAVSVNEVYFHEWLGYWGYKIFR